MTYGRLLDRCTITALLQNIYREDYIYADKEFTVWSITGPDGSEERKTMQLFSERFRDMYPGYTLESEGHIVAKPETQTISLRELMNFLKSKDE